MKFLINGNVDPNADLRGFTLRGYTLKPTDVGPPPDGVSYDCSSDLQALEDEERLG